MDSITQAALGAAIGETMLGRSIGNKGAYLGAIIATIPDLDVVLLPFYDSLQKISIHRGYSHSILASMIMALLIAAILSRIKWSRSIRFYKLLVFTWLTIITHLILDAFTSYGTQLYLPFSDERVSFDSIGVVDPAYTLPLLIGLIFTLIVYKQKPGRRKYTIAGLCISTLYLFTTLPVKYHMQSKLKEAMVAHHIVTENTLTVPVGTGSIHWYGVAKTEDSLYLTKDFISNGKDLKFEAFPVNDHLLNDLNPKLVDRMKWFAKDFYIVAEDEGKIRIYNMQCDMQGVRTFGDYLAPTAWYFEITPKQNGTYKLSTGMHPKSEK